MKNEMNEFGANCTQCPSLEEEQFYEEVPVKRKAVKNAVLLLSDNALCTRVI